MLLESIKLENFRQFRNEYIEFAQGSDGKNVTIIIGDNGTGKTTFAQAFFWCMYGETEFSDKNNFCGKEQNLLGKQGTAVPTRAKFIDSCRSRSL